MAAVNRLSAAVLGQGEYQHPSEPSVNAVYSEWTGLAKATTRTEVARSLNPYPRRELVRPSYAGAVQVSQSTMDIAENCIAIDYKPPTTPEAKFFITDHLGSRGNFEEAGNRLRKRYRLPMEPLPQRRADYTEDLHPLELCPSTQQMKDATTGERESTSPSARARTLLRLPGASDEEEDDTLFLDATTATAARATAARATAARATAIQHSSTAEVGTLAGGGSPINRSTGHLIIQQQPTTHALPKEDHLRSSRYRFRRDINDFETRLFGDGLFVVSSHGHGGGTSTGAGGAPGGASGRASVEEILEKTRGAREHRLRNLVNPDFVRFKALAASLNGAASGGATEGEEGAGATSSSTATAGAPGQQGAHEMYYSKTHPDGIRYIPLPPPPVSRYRVCPSSLLARFDQYDKYSTEKKKAIWSNRKKSDSVFHRTIVGASTRTSIEGRLLRHRDKAKSALKDARKEKVYSSLSSASLGD